MTVYFDGSKGRDDHDTTWLTLAALMAPEHVWNEFRWEWNCMLANRSPIAPYTHMKDLHTGNGPFKRTLGWGKTEATALTNDAIQVIQGFKFRYKKSIFATGIRVNLDAHEQIVSRGLAIHNPHEICVTASIGMILKQYCDTLREDSIQIWNMAFDQGEGFLHPFKKEWDRNRTKGRLIKNHLFWDLMDEPRQMDSKKEPGLQAADIFAWSFTRSLLSKERPWKLLSRFLLPRPGETGGVWPCATAEYGELELEGVVKRQKRKSLGDSSDSSE